MHCKSFWLTKWRICFFAWLHAHAGSSTMKIICNVNACQRSAVIDQLTWGVFRRARLKLNVLQVVEKTLQKMTNRTHNLNQPKKKSNYEKKNIKKDNTVQNESSTADNSAKPKGSHRCVRKKKGTKTINKNKTYILKKTLRLNLKRKFTWVRKPF